MADIKSNGSSKSSIVKYFSPDKKDVWTRELKMMSLLEMDEDADGREHMIKYRWHCSGNFKSRKFQQNSSSIYFLLQ